MSVDIPMIPIHELLDRIHWDKEFGRGDFVIGYYDRVADCIVHIPLCEIVLDPGDHFSFGLLDHDGVLQSIPLHRIKEVYKDRKLIWHREH